MKKLVVLGCGFYALLGMGAAAASFRPLPLPAQDLTGGIECRAAATKSNGLNHK